MKNFKRLAALFLAVVLVLSFSACSKSDTENSASDKELKKITLSLDWTPNTNHTGFYVALAKGYYRDAGFDVTVIQPPEGDANTACSAGQVQYAVAYQDLIAAGFDSNTPLDVTAVATILQHNTSCIASKKGSGMDRPSGLEGKEFLTWESPIELKMMEEVVTADGGDWSRVKRIPNTVTDEAHDIQANPNHAIWIYYGWGGINAEVNNIDIDTFYFKNINPVFDYYSPILIANNEYLNENPEEVRAFLSATQKGYEYAVENPEESAQLLIDGDETGSLIGSEEFVKRSQQYMSGQYIADAEKWGYIDKDRWDAFYGWLYKEGLTKTDLTQKQTFTNDYLS